MRKLIGYFLRLSVSLAALVMLTNCGDDVEDANLYIQYRASEKYQIYVVKALEPNQNASNGKNILGENLGIVNIGGKDFYAFKLKRKEYDIYTEWYFPGSYSGFTNDRERVNLKVNDWAKLVFWGSEVDDYRVLDGTGEVY